MSRCRKLISLIVSFLLIAEIFLAVLPARKVSAAPPKSQKIEKIVESEPRIAVPGVYWYQLDGGDFRADLGGGKSITTRNGGTASQPCPADEVVPDDVDLSRWPAEKWNDTVPASPLANAELKSVTWVHADSYTPVGEPVIIGKKVAEMKTITGCSHQPDLYERYGTNPKGNPKYLVMYQTPVDIVWQVKLQQEKEIEVGPDTTLQVGKTVSLNASVRTKDWGQDTWGPWENVSTRPETKWETSNPAVATVSSTGLVTAISPGSAVIRATWKSGEYELSDTAVITVTTASGPPDPPSYTITGDFDILPSNTIKWRDPFQLMPKNFQIPDECTYQYHQFRIERDGMTWTSTKYTIASASASFTYSSYPYVIGVGDHTVEIKISALCPVVGVVESDWIAAKTLTVISSGRNLPPVFEVGWTIPGVWTKAGVRTLVVVGTQLDLVYLDDPEPYDPDGDPFEFLGFDFTNQHVWAQSIPDKYQQYINGYHRILMDTPGTFCAKGTFRDSFGASASRSACVTVIPPNPIPIIDGPTEVKENRPLPQPISGQRSYSPAGYQIVEYIWENKKEKYTTPGTEIIKLDVVDDHGLKSLSPAVHYLTVLPDEPPVGLLEVEPLGVRVGTFEIYNKSYSPDGDKIASVLYRYKYDANNNGFDDDAWQDIAGDAAKITFRPSKVGKYLFDVYVCEDYGKCAWASDTQPEESRTLDVVNLAPSVSFKVEGKNEVPEPPGQNGIPPSRILNNWELYEVNTLNRMLNRPYLWSQQGNALMAGLGKGMEWQRAYSMSFSFGNGIVQMHAVTTPLADNGFGPNSLSPYRALAARDASRSGPILLPVVNPGSTSLKFTTGEDYADLVPAKFEGLLRSNSKYLYFTQSKSFYFSRYGDSYLYHKPVVFALNKNRIPPYRGDFEINVDPYWTTTEFKHYWDGPNPYDFILELGEETYEVPFFTREDQAADPDWRNKANAGDFSGASSKARAPSPYVSNVVEVTGSRIFNIFSANDKYAYAYNDYDSDDGWVVGFAFLKQNYLDIRIYDALTGQFLVSTYDRGDRVQLKDHLNYYRVLTRGENLILLYIGEEQHYLEFDRDGNLVKSGSVPLEPFEAEYERRYRDALGRVYTEPLKTYVCKWNGNLYSGFEFWKDADGNFYSYRNVECYFGESRISFDPELNPDAPDGMYLVQIKNDWTLGITANLPGNRLSKVSTGMYDFYFKEDNPIFFVDHINKKAVTRTYTVTYWMGYPGIREHSSVVNLETGEVSDWNMTPLRHFSDAFTPGFYLTHNGAYGQGWYSHSASGNLHKLNYQSGMTMKRSTTPYTYSERKTGVLRFGEYVGDGIWLSIYEGHYQDSGPGYSQGGSNTELYMTLDVGTPASANPYKTFHFGQWVSPDDIADGEYSFTVKMDDPRFDTKWAGFSFRMQDPTNRYALEFNGSAVALARYVNGARTVLASREVPMQPDVEYRFRIVAKGSRIEVFMNNVPYFDVDDTRFSSGKYGPFSDKQYVLFVQIEAKELGQENANWLTSYAIWEPGGVGVNGGAEVRYSDILFEDPEDDPQAGDFEWAITHTPKFLNHQGVSELHGKTFASPVLVLDKVGNYRIALRAKDDPNPDYPYPDMTFDEYRKTSNEYWRIITVHRRPVAQFTLSVDPETKNVVWDDQSYDPDRWLSPAVYDTENTGIDYQATRGILERRYFYITPGGEKVDSMLVAPQETGTYTVGLQVRDEYGAWSYWAVQEIEITDPVPPDEPPVAGFILSKTTLYRGETLTITSTAWDKEDGPAENLRHEYFIRNVTEGTGETMQSTSRGTWNKVFNSLGVMEIRQVVYDSKGQSAQAIQRVTVVNRPPAANFDWSPKPAFEGDAISLISTSSDPDGDPLVYHWSVQGPGGYFRTGSAQSLTIDGGDTLNRPGTYRVTLQIRDSHGAEDTVTKEIRVLELTIKGYVLHTDEWEENRQRYNAKNPGALRPADWFWAGEAFRLAAAVTDTQGSATKPESVVAEAAPELRKELAPASSDLVRWEGLLRSADAGFPLEELPQGPLTFVFTVRYSNGAVKTDTVTIQIRNTVHNYVQVHRLQ